MNNKRKMKKKRIHTTTNAGKDVGDKKDSYTAGGNINQYNHYGKQYGGFLKN
jgi:hypothetical protein